MGCLRALFVRIGCSALLFIALVLGFIYRERVFAAARCVRAIPPDALTQVVTAVYRCAVGAASRAREEAGFVAPGPGGEATAAAALRRLAERSGPAYVDLSAAQVSAVVDGAMRRAGGRAVDSLAVLLLEGELRVRGLLDLSGVPRSVLGPLAGALGEREPVTIGGTLEADSTGTLMLRLTALRIRDFPFPPATIPAIVRQLHIPGTRGAAVPVPGLFGVGDVRITPQHVRLYRSSP